MKRFFTFCLLLVAAGLRAADGPRHVVVLSVDGFRWDYAGRAHTPTLDSLRRVGTYAEMFPCFPSNTFPNHYSMATGLHPDHHGIVNNTFYDKALGRWYSIGDEASVCDPVFWRGEPVWNAAERQGLRAATFMWVGCQAPIGGRQASRWKAYDGAVGFRERAEWVLDELSRPADSVARLVMWYIEEPDHTAHSAGPDDPAITGVVERLDSLLGWFFHEARRSTVFDRTDFIVLSDHGMSALAPERTVNLWPLLDPARMRGAVNGNPLYLEPEPGYVDEVVRIASSQPHLQAWRREDIPAKYHYGTDTTRIMPVVVLPDPGWMAQWRETPRAPSGGNHGFDPFCRDMAMIFYGSGPDFKPGWTIAPFQNLNIHALVAHLLGIEPAEANDCDLEPLKTMLR